MPRIKTGAEKTAEIGTELDFNSLDFEDMGGWLRGWVGDLYWSASEDWFQVDGIGPEHVVAILEALKEEVGAECTSTRPVKRLS